MERIVSDVMCPNVDLSVFNNNADWTKLYGSLEDYLQPEIMEPSGKAVSINSFGDANHAVNVATRCLNTGNIMFIHNTPNIWFSKRQNTVDVDNFGNELVALRV